MTLADLQVKTLGAPRFDSPLASYVEGRATNQYYVAESDRILMDDTVELVQGREVPWEEIATFEAGGPRARLYFPPRSTRAAIVTCGGLCPGLNNVIRAVVRALDDHYGVPEVLGFRNGYAGLDPASGLTPVVLTRDTVADIHERGGTVLGSSRGARDPGVMVDTLVRHGIDILFVVGGDGSMRGAHVIHEEIERRGLEIAVVGVPKTIDNDIPHIGQSFGFQTAFAKAAESITAAKVEAQGALNGVAVVKTMGRHAGFIACYAALAAQTASFVLIPEVPFAMGGPNGLLAHLRRRVSDRGYAVIVVAEGAAQELLAEAGEGGTDASGNAVLADPARYVLERIRADYAARDEVVTLRYFDPGYTIRSVPADPADAVYCARLAQTAVHAAMSGRTDMVVGRRRHRFVNVPIPAVTQRSHNVSPDGDLWLSVLESTAQPLSMT